RLLRPAVEALTPAVAPRRSGRDALLEPAEEILRAADVALAHEVTEGGQFAEGRGREWIGWHRSSLLPDPSPSVGGHGDDPGTFVVPDQGWRKHLEPLVRANVELERGLLGRELERRDQRRRAGGIAARRARDDLLGSCEQAQEAKL